MGRGATRRRPRLGRPARDRPLYLDVVYVLRERIASGAWPGGMVMPPLRKVAAELGMGLTTVRLAVDVLKNEERLVPTAKRRLVVQAVGAAEPSPARTVLEVVPNLLDLLQRSRYFRQMQLGIESGASRIRAPLMICHDDHFRKAIPKGFLHFALRGLVVVGTVRPALVEVYAKLNVPVALVDQDGTRYGVHSVSVDNEAAGYEATRRLIEAGHRRIACVRQVLAGYGDVDPDSRVRQAGYERALRDAGLPKPPNAVFNTVSSARGAPGLMRLLSVRPRFTAAFVTSEGGARALVAVANRDGIAVPRAFSVAAVGALTPDAPEISAARADFYAMGLQAVKLLTEGRRPARNVKADVRWVDGKTIAAPSAEDQGPS